MELQQTIDASQLLRRSLYLFDIDKKNGYGFRAIAHLPIIVKCCQELGLNYAEIIKEADLRFLTQKNYIPQSIDSKVVIDQEPKILTEVKQNINLCANPVCGKPSRNGSKYCDNKSSSCRVAVSKLPK